MAAYFHQFDIKFMIRQTALSWFESGTLASNQLIISHNMNITR
ncbi:MAG: hypothetical protein WCG25_00615 [bacterium]